MELGRSSIVVMATAALAFMVAGVLPASGQDPILACAPASEILRVNVTAAHRVVAAPVDVTVELEPFAGGAVSEITAQMDDGTEPVSLPSPAPGTVAEAVLTLPGYVGRASVTVSWRQSAVEGVSAECRGVSDWVLEVGPSAGELRAFMARSARAQVLWLARGRRDAEIGRAFRATVALAPASAGAFLQVVREAAKSAGVSAQRLRPISRRYRAVVLSSRPPDGLGDENRDLARTAGLQEANIIKFYADLSRARTLAEITLAVRAERARYKYWRRFRAAWREALARANKEAAVIPPRWVTRVGV